MINKINNKYILFIITGFLFFGLTTFCSSTCSEHSEQSQQVSEHETTSSESKTDSENVTSNSDLCIEIETLEID